MSPTYTESLFEPLEAWIERVTDSLRPELQAPFAREADTLRLTVTRMLLEHAGRARQGFVPDYERKASVPAIDRLDEAIEELVAELRSSRIMAESDRRGAGGS